MNTVSLIRPYGLARADSNSAKGSDDQIPLLRQYLRIALRWKWVTIGSVVLFLLMGVVATLLMTPKYTATTTLEIARESDKVVNLQGVRQESNVADQEFYQTQYGLLRSQSLAERVAGQLKLADDVKFFKMFKATRDPRLFPAAELSSGRLSPVNHAERQRLAGSILIANLAVTPTRLSRLVEISFTSPDPLLSTNVANAWSTNFIQSSLDRKYQATAYARRFLESRLDQLRRRLEESERLLVGYASAQQIINLPGNNGGGDRSIVGDNLAALNTALAQATADRIQAEARFEQGGRAGTSAEALQNTAINGLRQRRAELAAEYQKLMVQFEPEYPAARAIKSQLDQLDRSISREEGRVQTSLGASFREASERESALNTRVQGLKQSVLDLRRRSIQYNIYQREVDTNRSLYDGLLQRYKEIGIAGGVGVNNVSVVDPAEVPDRPSSPRLLLNLLAALLVGGALGVLAAIVLEQTSESVADPAEVERSLGLPLLGVVPHLNDVEPVAALADRKSELVDAYLAVRTALEFSTEQGVPSSVAVTSTRPSEGKSTTALSLAVVLARSQKRVILVDGDMRSPSVHELLNKSNDRGLSNYLSGNDAIESLVTYDNDFGITVMPAGPVPPNAAELLTGDRLPKLISALLETYDHIVIDAPPVLGLADAPMVAGRVQATIYAVEAHGIRLSLVRTALSRLAGAHAHVLGVVVTKFRARRAHFGYGYDYGYGYGRGAEGRDHAR